MAKIYGLDGKEITSEPVVERIRPEIPMDTTEGHFLVPVVLLAAGQYASLVADVAKAVADILCPDTLEAAEIPPTEPEPAILS